jgi:ribosomal protein L32
VERREQLTRRQARKEIPVPVKTCPKCGELVTILGYYKTPTKIKCPKCGEEFSSG